MAGAAPWAATIVLERHPCPDEVHIDHLISALSFQIDATVELSEDELAHLGLDYGPSRIFDSTSEVLLVLAAIADWPECGTVTFFGGTALCRTWLPDLRLSEDIDLLIDSPTDGADLRQHNSRRLRREFPNLAWTRLGTQHQVETRRPFNSATRICPTPLPSGCRRRTGSQP